MAKCFGLFVFGNLAPLSDTFFMSILNIVKTQINEIAKILHVFFHGVSVTFYYTLAYTTFCHTTAFFETIK